MFTPLVQNSASANGLRERDARRRRCQTVVEPCTVAGRAVRRGTNGDKGFDICHGIDNDDDDDAVAGFRGISCLTARQCD